MGELSILSPKPEVVQVDGVRVKIFAVRLRDFERFGQAASGLFAVLGAFELEQILAYAQRHGEELAEVLEVTTSLSHREVRRLKATVSLELLVHVVRVNAGFFGQAQAAMAKALAGLQLLSD